MKVGRVNSAVVLKEMSTDNWDPLNLSGNLQSQYFSHNNTKHDVKKS